MKLSQTGTELLQTLFKHRLEVAGIGWREGKGSGDVRVGAQLCQAQLTSSKVAEDRAERHRERSAGMRRDGEAVGFRLSLP